MPRRPSSLIRWAEIEAEEEGRHPGTGESRTFSANLGRAAGLTRIGVRHERLMPGRRTSPPHAERDEEELVFILEGEPDLWQDGHLHRLRHGLGVGWADRTGVHHSIQNNTDAPVRLLSIGEASRVGTAAAFLPGTREQVWAAGKGVAWADPPRRRFGSHDGLTDAMRGQPVARGRARPLPPNVVDWRDHVPEVAEFPGDPTLSYQSVGLSKPWDIHRLGVWVEIMQPGWRSSRPHAEGDEEEFVVVLEGAPTLWQNGYLHPLQPGDFCGWPNETGIAHTIINNSDAAVVMLVVGEASLQRSRIWYPFHETRMKELGERAWIPVRPPKFGPHKGVPDKPARKGS